MGLRSTVKKSVRICNLLNFNARVTIPNVSFFSSVEVSMVSILDEFSKITTGRADFVVAGNSIEELLDSSTAHAVVKRAAELGFNKPGVSNMGGPYPVDADGKTDDELLMGKRGPVAGYRRDFTVLASI
jgi:hypothetical protein